jgi:phosphoserine phosphatase
MGWRFYKEKLYFLRMEKGWTQEQAFLECDACDKKQYHLWESGKILRPRKGTLEKIAIAFGLDSPEELKLNLQEKPDPEYAFRYAQRHMDDTDVRKPSQSSHYKLVCFDVDGTLLKGFDFSWKLIWEFLGDDGTERKKGLHRFHRKEITYEQWCNYCCAEFQSRGLNRRDFRKITKSVRLTRNFYDAIALLKSRGYKLAIISGGVDTFLEEKIPGYGEIFDYVFINKILFVSEGNVRSVVPTSFDFERKPLGIEYICKKEGISLDNTVFVGDTFNDKHVFGTAGLTIAYQPNSIEIREIFDVIVEDDDLLRVVSLFLDGKVAAA